MDLCFSSTQTLHRYSAVGSFTVGSTDYNTQSGSRENKAVGQNRLFDVVMVWHRPDWAGQSGKALDPVGQTGPVGSTDYPVGYGLYPLARLLFTISNVFLTFGQRKKTAFTRRFQIVFKFISKQMITNVSG